MYIGALVSPTSSNTVLACGCGGYDCAVVVSIHPFLLISEAGDMLWTTKRRDDFAVVGQVGPQSAQNVLDRIERDSMASVPESTKSILRDLAFAGFAATI